MTTTRLTEIRADLEDGIDADDAVWLLSLAEQLQGQLDEARAENARPAAQDRASGPETPEGSTGRDTGAPNAQNPAQASVPNTATERIEQIRTGLADLNEVDHGMTGVKGRYGWRFNSASQTANLYQDLRWLLDHVDRLNTVLTDEQPDVDGWTIYPTTDGGLMVSHDTDADRPVLAADDSIPLAAVLAFIADADDATEGDPK